MIRLYTYTLLLLSILLQIGCSSVSKESADPNSKIVSRIVAQQSSEKAIEEACRVIDSVAMQPVDTLNEASHKVLPTLIKDICKALKDQNRVREAAAVAAYPYGVDAEQNNEIAMRLLTSTLLPGTNAPAIAGLSVEKVNDQRRSDTPSAKQQPRFTVLLFHESSCRTCQGIIRDIKEQYNELQKVGVRIVSISTDTDEKTWNEYATTLPWADKLCDYKGFYGQNMISWGVAATPTLFLINGDGIVVDQYDTLKRMLKDIFVE